jgi:hypothetical protein
MLMAATEFNHLGQSADPGVSSPLNLLAERVGYYFDKHPEVSRDEFLVEAVRREIYFREQRDLFNLDGQGGVAARRPPSAEDVRVHAWVAERLAAIHREQQSSWRKFKRFFSDHIGRWFNF